uniref:Uncharacterized protein n=1 Tax=Chromera velia CCMP2878 TaxID=1169474 RepID=A0A0G4FXA1_9ALVE|eukprot:Cvel_19089.t1-p1 / transcript=Cvel_19089.t1 / gene=Cvel_19089 / organism=Chromera_velia_CCMP2878 / gene_product=hypothetical protein / transcript_product=hypothetical protein / location=Cvel_scaffold1620:33317-37457(+) / protein_length=1046 / sequence_SO=supercontig / SO=protein_coding / is_pseudo=false
MRKNRRWTRLSPCTILFVVLLLQGAVHECRGDSSSFRAHTLRSKSSLFIFRRLTEIVTGERARQKAASQRLAERKRKVLEDLSRVKQSIATLEGRDQRKDQKGSKGSETAAEKVMHAETAGMRESGKNENGLPSPERPDPPLSQRAEEEEERWRRTEETVEKLLDAVQTGSLLDVDSVLRDCSVHQLRLGSRMSLLSLVEERWTADSLSPSSTSSNSSRSSSFLSALWTSSDRSRSVDLLRTLILSEEERGGIAALHLQRGGGGWRAFPESADLSGGQGRETGLGVVREEAGAERTTASETAFQTETETGEDKQSKAEKKRIRHLTRRPLNVLLPSLAEENRKREKERVGFGVSVSPDRTSVSRETCPSFPLSYSTAARQRDVLEKYRRRSSVVVDSAPEGLGDVCWDRNALEKAYSHMDDLASRVVRLLSALFRGEAATFLYRDPGVSRGMGMQLPEGLENRFVHVAGTEMRRGAVKKGQLGNEGKRLGYSLSRNETAFVKSLFDRETSFRLTETVSFDEGVRFRGALLQEDGSEIRTLKEARSGGRVDLVLRRVQDEIEKSPQMAGRVTLFAVPEGDVRRRDSRFVDFVSSLRSVEEVRGEGLVDWRLRDSFLSDMWGESIRLGREPPFWSEDPCFVAVDNRNLYAVRREEEKSIISYREEVPLLAEWACMIGWEALGCGPLVLSNPDFLHADRVDRLVSVCLAVASFLLPLFVKLSWQHSLSEWGEKGKGEKMSEERGKEDRGGCQSGQPSFSMPIPILSPFLTFRLFGLLGGASVIGGGFTCEAANWGSIRRDSRRGFDVVRGLGGGFVQVLCALLLMCVGSVDPLGVCPESGVWPAVPSSFLSSSSWVLELFNQLGDWVHGFCASAGGEVEGNSFVLINPFVLGGWHAAVGGAVSLLPLSSSSGGGMAVQALWDSGGGSSLSRRMVNFLGLPVTALVLFGFCSLTGQSDGASVCECVSRGLRGGAFASPPWPFVFGIGAVLFEFWFWSLMAFSGGGGGAKRWVPLHLDEASLPSPGEARVLRAATLALWVLSVACLVPRLH